MDPELYKENLKRKPDAELVQEYRDRRRRLTAPPLKFPAGIELDITYTDWPGYKMEMFNAVVQEITRRVDQAKTVEELASFADLFFIRDTKVPKGKGQRRKRRRRASNNSLIAR